MTIKVRSDATGGAIQNEGGLEAINVGSGGIVTFPQGAIVPGMQVGQCRLTRDGSGNLLLAPYEGTYIYINGVFRAIPSAGVTLSPTGVPASTTLYIYASWTGSTIALSADTVAPVKDSNSGVRVKSNNSGFTLVGMARSSSAPAWIDTTSQRFVLSWFNKRPIQLWNPLVSTSVVSGTTSWIASGPTVEFLTWANELVEISTIGAANVSVGEYAYINTDFDATLIPNDPGSIVQSGSIITNIPISLTYRGYLSEGYHSTRMISKNSTNGASFSVVGSSGPGLARTICNGFVMG